MSEIGKPVCGPCGRPRTSEGHDGCLGTLSDDVMNACCGHRGANEPYIQYGTQDECGKWTETYRIAGAEALEEFEVLCVGPSFQSDSERLAFDVSPPPERMCSFCEQHRWEYAITIATATLCLCVDCCVITYQQLGAWAEEADRD